VIRLAGAALALALLCCACEGTKAAAPHDATTTSQPPLTEEQWSGRYALWVTDLRVALLHEDRAFLKRCESTLAEELGDAPPPLRSAERILVRACERFARGAETGDARQSFLQWSQAALLVRGANNRLPTPQPMERLPLPVGQGLSTTSRIEPLFTRVARDIVAPATEVRCWSPSDWSAVQKESFGGNRELAGFASAAFKRVNLAWDICSDLATLAYTSRRPGGAEELDIAFAVTTLMHEAGHLKESGDFYGAGENEPLAECWGMQHIRAAARALGASQTYADELAGRYWAELYPERPPEYRTHKCRDGGAYDVRKDSPVWP
jgi:hypothetical protein